MQRMEIQSTGVWWQADRSGGRITDTHIVTDVSNTGKGILIGSDTEADTYVVTGDGDLLRLSGRF